MLLFCQELAFPKSRIQNLGRTLRRLRLRDFGLYSPRGFGLQENSRQKVFSKRHQIRGRQLEVWK
jgi:hypothetical protein